MSDTTPPMIPGENIKKYRLQAGLSLRVVAGLIGRDHSWLSRVETGGRRVERIEDAMRLARVLNVPLEALCDRAVIEPEESQVLSPVPATTGLDVPWTATGAMSVLRTITEEEEMDRRNFLSVTGAALTAPALAWMRTPAPQDVTREVGTRVVPQVAQAFDEITGSLRRMDDQLGGAAVLDLAGAPLRQITDLLSTRSYTESVGRQLTGTAAELLRLCGWLAHDSGQRALSQRYWAAGLRAAHTAGDRAVAANILAFQADQLKDGTAEDRKTAVRLAETARHGYPGGSTRMAALLDMRAAAAYSSIGEASPCRKLIDSALDKLRGPSENDPTWVYWFDEAQAAEMAGSAYLRLQHWETARELIETSMSERGAAFSREGALAQIQYAKVLVGQQEYSEAATVGSRVLDVLDNQVSSPRCLSRLADVADSLRDFYTRSSVREFVGRVHEMSRQHRGSWAGKVLPAPAVAS